MEQANGAGVVLALKLPLVVEILIVTRTEPSSFHQWSARLTLLLLLISTTGCGVMSNGRGWGQDAFSDINRKTISQSAWNAFTDIKTLLPLGAAVVLSIDDLDEELSDWARDETPIFGSEDNAEDISDILRAALQVEIVATVLATPSGNDRDQWWHSKLKGLGVAALAVGLETATTQTLKHTVNRTRPNEDDQLSFPSGHSSNAFASATLSNRHLDAIDLSPLVKKSLQTTNLALASATAWARVEGGNHFPRDILTGAAIGHFFSAFIYDAFIGNNTSGPQRFNLVVGPEENGMKAQLFIPLY